MNNNILHTAAATLLALAMTACDSFLDEQPRGMAIADDVTVYDGMFNTLSMMNMSISLYYPYAQSDELVYTEDENNVMQSRSTYGSTMLNAYQYKDKVIADDQPCEMWENVYNKIYTYNAIANGVMSASGDQTQKQYVEAEARASRAYMHFLLAQWFAMPYNDATADQELAVPIVTEANTQASGFRRATVRELYNWVTSELEYAAPRLEDREEHRQRVYMPTGYALLGKVYFFMGQYDKALEPLRTAYDKLKNSTTVYLTDQNEKQAAYGYKELSAMQLNSFIPYTFRDNEVLWCKNNPGSAYFYFAYYGRHVGLIKDKFYALYDSTDLRRNLISTYDSNGEPLEHPSACIYGSKPNLGVSLPEVILMLAECEARVGSEANAREILTNFRSKRMLTGHEAIPDSVSTKDDLVRFCVDEETREYMGSGYRWYNIRRLWNDPLFQDWKPITHTYNGQTYTLKEAQLKLEIPETVLQWNESWRGNE